MPCLLSRVCECLHSGLDCVDWEHECMLQDSCNCSRKHVLQGTPYIISKHFHCLPQKGLI